MRRHLPLLAICLGYFMVILDATIVNVALPSIGRDLGGGVGGLQWVVDAYTVVFAGLLLSAGSIGDLIGSRKVLDTGLGLFTAASAACALAPSVAGAGRRPRGAGARGGADGPELAGAVAGRLPGHRRAGPGGRRLGRRWPGSPPPPGPILGGVLVSIADWRAVFIVNLPVGLLAMWLSYRHLPKAGERSDAGLDPPGQVLGVLTLTLLTLGLIEGGVVGLGVAAGADRTDRVRAGAARVPRGRARAPATRCCRCSCSRTARSPARRFVGLAINLGFYGELFAISLYFQRVRGFSALETGLALLPEGVFVALVLGAVGAADQPYRTAGADARRAAARAPPASPALIVAGRSTPYAVLVPRPDRGRASGWRSRCPRRPRPRSRPRRPSARGSPRACSTPPPGRRRDRRRAAGHAAGRQLVRVGAAPGNCGERCVVLDRRGGHRARRRPGGPPAARAACRAHRRS